MQCLGYISHKVR